MRRRIENLLFALIVIALIGCGALGPRALAMSVSQPSRSQIQDVSICSGTPAANSLLFYDGTNWCGSQTPAVSTLTADGGTASAASIIATSAGLGDLLLTAKLAGDVSPRYIIDPGVGLLIGNGTSNPPAVIDEGENWKGTNIPTTKGGTGLAAYPQVAIGPQLLGSNISLTANTLTAVVTFAFGTIPAAPDSHWELVTTGQVTFLNGATAGTCAIEVSDVTATAGANIGLGASIGASITTSLYDVLTSGNSLTVTLSAECTQAATAEKNNFGITTVPGTVLNVAMIPL